jgi:defect-in-organelle-trafficking protein DotC
MSHTFKKLLFLFLSTTLLSACSQQTSLGKGDYSRIKNLPPPTAADAFSVPKIRLAAIEQTAASLGAQGALAWTSKGINASLERDDQHLTQVFNFRALLLNNNVLPPVLSEGRDMVASDDPNSLRLADKVYKIESTPRFVTAAPTWREYLWMSYTPPERPNVSLLPRDAEEQKAWDQYYDQGWKDGIVQANQIFSENMGRLKRDYNGMILYRKLLAQKIVTPPYVAKSDLGITGDANEVRINDQVLRITATSQLVTDSKQWKSVVIPGTPGAIRKQGTIGTETLE